MTNIWDKTDYLEILGGACVACDKPRMARRAYCNPCLRRNLLDMEMAGTRVSPRLVHDLVNDLMRVNEKPVALYRYFDADRRLLYVGISNQPEVRRVQHMENSGWYRFVAAWSIEWYDERSTAARQELVAIEVEAPVFNRAGSDVKRQKRATEYLMARGASDLLTTSI